MIGNFHHRYSDALFEIYYTGFPSRGEAFKFSKIIDGVDKKAFLKLYNKLPAGALNRCHIPHHGFRIYDEDAIVIFDCEICYLCDSLHYYGPAVRNRYLTFMAESEKAKELLLFYETHLGKHPLLGSRE